MNLFRMTFTIDGKAASYDREVIVVAESPNDAQDKIYDHFRDANDIVCVEVLGKFRDDIFGLVS